MDDLLVLIPLLPLVAAVFNLVLGRWYVKDKAGYIAIAGVAGAWAISLAVFIDQLGSDEPLAQHLFTWIPAGSFNVELNLYVDHLSALMLMVVTSVSLLVHIYSLGYMKGDGGYYRFFSFLPLFVFSMVMLVLADNFLVLFAFWEAVGLCSYLLIGYYFRRTSAANAAKKAFIVNRIGDFGFGIGIMLIFVELNTIVFQEVFANIGSLPQSTVNWIAILLFCGAIGKSAQFPLFVWLPDAMEGPTPVSALIHAATMVTAGVYMVARCYPIFSISHDAMRVISIVGATTAIIAATIAVTQFDIKRVVAYSTVSQLGYMLFALGSGAWVAALFHLATHAVFKALLFLGSGSVIHGLHEEQDMRRMGGLKKYMPITYWTFLIGAAANAGIIPFAGFWSKDEILLGAWVGDYPWVAVAGFLAAFLTSLYMFRVVFLTFHGEERFDAAKLHPHESPRVMTYPLIILAAGSIFAGAMAMPPDDGWVHHFLKPIFSTESTSEGLQATTGVVRSATDVAEEHHATDGQKYGVMAISIIIALSGFLVAYGAYIKRSTALDPKLWSKRFGAVYTFVFRKWMFDELYDAMLVRPLYWMSMFLWQFIDVRIIDGTVNGVASVVTFSSARLRRVQTGFVANYALAIALGAVVIVGVYFVLESSLFT